MKKCIVLKSFKDKENNEVEVTSNSEYICSEERANHLSLLGFVKILDEEPTTESDSNSDDEEPTTESDSEIETATLIDKTKKKNAKR